MFRWVKLGKIFDPVDLQGECWMREFAQSPCVVVHDEYVRVYFCSRPFPTEDGQYRSYLAFIDLERSDLTQVKNVCQQPAMKLGGLGCFDEFGTNPISVIRDGEHYRVYFAGWTRCESVPINGAIGVAVSKDGGNSFERLGDGPVISYSLDEPFMMGSPRIRKFNDKWTLWYVAGKEWIQANGRPEPVYRIRMATSENGYDWEKVGRDLIENRLGERECQACPDVLYRDGFYHMFFSYRSTENYKTSQGGYRIGYASSSDMLNWRRDDDKAGMQVSECGWDSEMVNYPHVFMLDGDVYMLYQGNEMGRTGMGLARMARGQHWGRV
jgi:predicted GH43/DUF377 family glycosyl hydrolase